MSADARCLCGKVSFTVNEDTQNVSVCHCEMCRRWNSGPMMAVHLHETPDIIGEEHIVWFKSSEWAERGFCGTCGTSLFYRLGGETPTYIAAAGAFLDPSKFQLESEIFIDEKPDFYGLDCSVPTMTGAEVFAMHTPSEEPGNKG